MPLQQTFAAAFTSGIVLWWDKPWVRTDHIILHLWKQNTQKTNGISSPLLSHLSASLLRLFFTEGVISEDDKDDDDDDDDE